MATYHKLIKVLYYSQVVVVMGTLPLAIPYASNELLYIWFNVLFVWHVVLSSPSPST